MNKLPIIQYKIEPSRKEKGFPTLLYSGEENKRIYVHSRVKPSSEKRAVEILGSEVDSIISFGFGLGYQWQPELIPGGLKNLFVYSENFLVVRDNINIIEKILRAEIKSISEPGKTWGYFSLEQKVTKLKIIIMDSNQIQDSFNGIFKEINKSSFLIYYYPPVIRIMDQFGLTAPDLRKMVKEYFSATGTSNETKKHFSFLWHKNILKNLSSAVSLGKPIRFLKAISPLKKGRDVFVAGASQNLCKVLSNANFRNHVKKFMIVISTDSAEGVLAHYRVFPHVILSADASVFNVNQISRRLTSDSLLEGDRPLRLSNLVSPRLLFWNDLTSAIIRNHPLEQLLFEFLGKKYWSATGSHIGATALEIAHLLRPNKIWTAGIDLCYENGITYGAGTPYTDFFLRSVGRLFSYPESMMAQLRRMNAKKSDKSFLYRRATLDRALEEMSDWIKDKDLSEKIVFLNLPEEVALEYKLNFLNIQELTVKELNGNSPGPADPLAGGVSPLREALVFEELSTGELKSFFRILPDLCHDGKISRAMFDHWDQDNHIQLERIEEYQNRLGAIDKT